jgi:hypothetical protein
VAARDWSKWRLGTALGLVGGFFVTGAVLVGRALDPPVEPPPARDLSTASLEYPGLVCPPPAPAAAAKLKDSESVIGVVIDGRPRAYVVKALSYPQTHVVDDVVAGHPVTVTYCDIKDCTRVFTGNGDGPLDVGVGGYDDGLLLRANGRRYRQYSGEAMEPGEPLPLAQMGFVRTTWKEWRDAHPDTDVVGATALGG